MVLLLWACHASKSEAPPPPSRNVFLLTVDTVNSDFLGLHSDWNTTPTLDALFQQSMVFPNTQTVRGITIVAMPSFLSGFYPYKTKQRGFSKEGWSGKVPLLQERFQQAGYQTFGLSSNMCTYISTGMDLSYCSDIPSEAMNSDVQLSADATLGPTLFDALDKRDPDRLVFVWVHMLLPHEQYEKVEPYYSEFHPDAYAGSFSPGDMTTLDQQALNNEPLDPDAQRELEAWYATGLRQADANIKQILDGLKERNLYDDSIIVYGADHGEELGKNPDWFYPNHGCSYHAEVTSVVWSIRMPKGPTGILSDWVSTVDMAPTILDLADIPWKGHSPHGQSLKPAMYGESWQPQPVFAERGVSSATVRWKGYRYLLDPPGGFGQCPPFDEHDAVLPGPLEALWRDGDQETVANNLLGTGIAEEAELHQLLCDWVSISGWGGGKTTLADACQ